MFDDIPPFAEIMRSMAWLLVLAASFLMPILSIALVVLSGGCLLGYVSAAKAMAFSRRNLVPVRA